MMRYSVNNMLYLMAPGMTTDDLIDDYPDLEKEDCFAYLES